MAIRKEKSNIAHVSWIDLRGNGVLVECAVLKEDGFGNIHYLEIANLDDVDKGRIGKILTGRNAETFELWDLMGQVQLNNGINGLEYFHQLVKVITPDGVIMNPRAGVVGTGVIDTNSKEDMASVELNNSKVESVPENTATPAEKRAATMAAKKAGATPAV